MTWPPTNFSRTEDGNFDVLGLVRVVLPGPWWWQTEDFNDAGGGRGAIFRCYEEGYVAEDGNLQELAYLLVADVSDDPTEPDITRFVQADVEGFDRFLEQEIRHLMSHDGRTMVNWMSSHLSETSSGAGLMSAYIARDSGRERQYMDARVNVGGRKVVIGGCFDVQRKDDLAVPVFWAVQQAAVNGRLR